MRIIFFTLLSLLCNNLSAAGYESPTEFIKTACPAINKKRKLTAAQSNTLEQVPSCQNTVAMIPGSFNPPHREHFDLIKNALEEANNIYIVIYLEKGERKGRHGISYETSCNIWRRYLAKIKNLEEKDDFYCESKRTFKFIKTEDDPHEYHVNIRRLPNFNSYIRVFAGSDRREYIKYEDAILAYRFSERDDETSSTKLIEEIKSHHSEEYLKYLPDELTVSEKQEIIQMLLDELGIS
jgi:hypothetical protein